MDALAQVIGSIEDRVKAEVAKEFTKLAYGALSPANSQPWNRDGFYTARHASELAAHGFLLPQMERDFSVPADCPFWGAPFVEGQQVFRGFLRHAWMPLPEGPSTGVVAVIVHGSPAGLRASLGGAPLVAMSIHGQEPSLLLWHLNGATPDGMLHLHCDGPVIRSPQHGRVSCFVSKPFWHR